MKRHTARLQLYRARVEATRGERNRERERKGKGKREERGEKERQRKRESEKGSGRVYFFLPKVVLGFKRSL